MHCSKGSSQERTQLSLSPSLWHGDGEGEGGEGGEGGECGGGAEGGEGGGGEGGAGGGGGGGHGGGGGDGCRMTVPAAKSGEAWRAVTKRCACGQ